MTGRINIGTSGWSYDEWMGPVYPPGMKKAKMLDFFVQLFKTCEINTSFYNMPNDMVVRAWDKKAPDDFTFAAKIYQGFTHEAKLDFRKIGNGLNVFMDRFKPLDKKIHSYLLQLPPSFSRATPEHLANLEKFVAFWGRNWPPEKLAVEFRHLSWMVPETFGFLRDHDAAYCIVIEPLLPPVQEITSQKRTYIRFHGFGKDPWFNYNFTQDQLKEWTANIKNLASKVDDVHVYFNNHFSGYAVKNAMDLMDFIDMSHTSLTKIQNDFSPMKGQTRLL
nr:DUF72 domain-containing protein [Candidatus Sigynarchaeota archaeon]